MACGPGSGRSRRGPRTYPALLSESSAAGETSAAGEFWREANCEQETVNTAAFAGADGAEAHHRAQGLTGQERTRLRRG